MIMDQWYLNNLVCPVDKTVLKYQDGILLSSSGNKYPVIDGIPVMLVDKVEQTQFVATASLERAKKNSSIIDKRAQNLYLESLGISEEQKKGVIQSAICNDFHIDPVVSYIVAATNGNAYKGLAGKLKSYPIPELRLPDGNGNLLLDIGCNWGRWSIAASRKGYTVIGLDPSFGAVMAARRVARQLRLPIKYIVGDARFLPFRDSSFDNVFSYSVLQHFSKENAVKSIREIGRVLNSKGTSLVQMPNFLGVGSLRHQFKRKFREPIDFEVRYWSVSELVGTFNESIGESVISVDCYFGLGLQKSDSKYMSSKVKLVIAASEMLRRLQTIIPILKYVADSLYVQSQKTHKNTVNEKSR